LGDGDEGDGDTVREGDADGEPECDGLGDFDGLAECDGAGDVAVARDGTVWTGVATPAGGWLTVGDGLSADKGAVGVAAAALCG
jgi:hypothetical protein